MSGHFLTNPSNTPGQRKSAAEKTSSYEYRQKVVKSWMNMGVPLRPAEVAGIDMKSNISIAQKHKLPPHQTAKMLHGEVKRIYTSEEGEWHFQQKAVLPSEEK